MTANEGREQARFEALQLNGGYPIWPEAAKYIWDAALASLPAVPAATKELIASARKAAKWDSEMEYEGGRSSVLTQLAEALEVQAAALSALTGEQETE